MSRLAYSVVVRKPRRAPTVAVAHNKWQAVWLASFVLLAALFALLSAKGWWSGDDGVWQGLSIVAFIVDAFVAIMLTLGAINDKVQLGHVFNTRAMRDELRDQRALRAIGPGNSRIMAAADSQWVTVYEESVSTPRANGCVTLSQTELRRFDASHDEGTKRAHEFVAEERERIEQKRLNGGNADESVIAARALANCINEAA